MKDRLKASMSPEQLAGGGDVATNFIKGSSKRCVSNTAGVTRSGANTLTIAC
jgi:hypothetical protein